MSSWNVSGLNFSCTMTDTGMDFCSRPLSIDRLCSPATTRKLFASILYEKRPSISNPLMHNQRKSKKNKNQIDFWKKKDIPGDAMGCGDDEFRIEDRATAIMHPVGSRAGTALYGHLERKRIGRHDVTSDDFFLWYSLRVPVVRKWNGPLQRQAFWHCWIYNWKSIRHFLFVFVLIIFYVSNSLNGFLILPIEHDMQTAKIKNFILVRIIFG